MESTDEAGELEETIEDKKTYGKSDDGLNWKELGQETKNVFKFNPENRSGGMIVKASLIIFATSLAPSLFDMGSDAFSVHNFIHGTTYTKYVSDLDHPSVNSSDCVHVGSYLKWNGNSSTVVYEEFECFEQDPIWGQMSLVFMFLPGIFGAIVWKGAYRGVLLAFFTSPIFPFVALIVKTMGLLNPGKNWKLLAKRLTTAEALGESRCQFFLQLFIVFTRADRAPSSVQLVTLASSLVMLIVSSINETRRVQKTVELEDDIQRAGDVLPAILTANLVSIGCLPLLVTLLRYWVLLPLGLFLLAFTTILLTCYMMTKYKDMMDDPTKGRVTVGRIEINEYEVVMQFLFKIFWLIGILLLTCLTITANLHPSLKLPGLFWQVSIFLFLKI